MPDNIMLLLKNKFSGPFRQVLSLKTQLYAHIEIAKSYPRAAITYTAEHHTPCEPRNFLKQSLFSSIINHEFYGYHENTRSDYTALMKTKKT
jgi:hypothetical protein